jgi:NADPH2:quinone reductase
MKAVVMTAKGGPEVLQVTELPTPALRTPHDLLVRLKAAAVNPLDTKIRQAHMMFPDNLPAVLGCDGAGVVEQVGATVHRFRPGDEVYFFNNGLGGPPGNYCEYAVLHEDFAAAKPRNLSFSEAAAVPLVLITAWEALVYRAGLQAHHRVLVHAGVGGVGHVALQLARHLGAQVAATVSGPDKAALAKSLGAELTIDYRTENFVEASLAWTEGRGVDVVFDTVGGVTFCQSFAAARLYGRVISLLSTRCELPEINTARLRNLIIGYVQMTAPLFFGDTEARRCQTRILEQGAKLIEEGTLKVIVSEVMPLERAADAHRKIEAGGTTGKIVLEIA